MITKLIVCLKGTGARGKAVRAGEQPAAAAVAVAAGAVGAVVAASFATVAVTSFEEFAILGEHLDADETGAHAFAAAALAAHVAALIIFRNSP
mmetsp:Transcript_20959/g.23521  ORF Transcript_20959/g.23521 Transcript_20959/m.23521 type:complete len:93 (-) Transcript_20959:101-379(-)